MGSIQIVGGNNAGKTSLINTLNFLYIDSDRDKIFDHDFKTTINYYFRYLDKSYILFEIFKDSYFCILLKRNENNKLEYYKINSSYSEIEDRLFEYRADTKLLLGFAQINENLLDRIAQLNSKELRTLIYGRSKSSKSVLWLNRDITPTIFSKIYRYLINTKLITNETLKEALLTADNKHGAKREFYQSDNSKIEDIKRLQNETRLLRDSKDEFFAFKDRVEEYYLKKNELGELYQLFYQKYNDELRENREEQKALSAKISSIENDKILPLKQKLNSTNRELGVVESDIKHKKREIEGIDQSIKKIQSYDPIEFLKHQRKINEDEIDSLTTKIGEIKSNEYTKATVESTITKLDQQSKVISNKINNFDNLLIQHISSDPMVTQKINAYLSKEVLGLDRGSIHKVIESIEESGVLHLFDGVIDVSTVEPRAIESVEELKKEIEGLVAKLDRYHEILKSIENRQKLEQELHTLKTQNKLIDRQIEESETLEAKQTQKAHFENDLRTLESDKEQIVKEQKRVEEQIKAFEEEIVALGQKKRGYIKRATQLSLYYAELKNRLDMDGLNFSDSSDRRSVDKIVELIRGVQRRVDELKSQKDRTFDMLKMRLAKEHSDERAFIKEVEQDIMSIQDKERSVTEILETIANDISKPTQDFLDKLRDFKSFVASKSRKFKQYQISDLDTIEITLKENKEIIQDLKAIAHIDKSVLFSSESDFSYDKQISILKRYIEESKKFRLSNLFDIVFRIDGKSVDLRKQTESNGTDRVLKITLLLLIVSDLVIKDAKNRLVLYIDELGEVDEDNIAGLIERCKEHNFIPIVASPAKQPHIDRYYDLVQKDSRGQIIVDDKRAIDVKERV